MRDGRSPIWGGATLGLFVGLILGFFVGTYWMTLLYAVLIGAAVGAATNVLAWMGGHKSASSRSSSTQLLDDRFRLSGLQIAEEGLRHYSAAEFDTDPLAAANCVGIVHSVEDKEDWRAAYDSLESFYAAHEARHPDIRVYATVYREAPFEDLDDADPGIPQRIVQHRQTAATTRDGGDTTERKSPT
jgi:hypothetical protein